MNIIHSIKNSTTHKAALAGMLAAIATYIAHYSTTSSYFFFLGEPKMPAHLIEKQSKL